MSKPERITYKRIFHEVMEVLNLEKGLIYTFKEMLLRPKSVVQEYLFQRRDRLFNPFRYVFLGVALQLLVILNTKFFKQEFSKMDEELSNIIVSLEQREIFKKIIDVILAGNNVLVLIGIPLTAFLTYFLLNKNTYTKAEHTVILSYIVGTVSILTALISLPMIIFNNIWASAIGFTIPLLLYYPLAKSIFEENWLRTFIRFTLAYYASSAVLNTLAVSSLYAYFWLQQNVF